MRFECFCSVLSSQGPTYIVSDNSVLWLFRGDRESRQLPHHPSSREGLCQLWLWLWTRKSRKTPHSKGKGSLKPKDLASISTSPCSEMCDWELLGLQPFSVTWSGGAPSKPTHLGRVCICVDVCGSGTPALQACCIPFSRNGF